MRRLKLVVGPKLFHDEIVDESESVNRRSFEKWEDEAPLFGLGSAFLLPAVINNHNGRHSTKVFYPSYCSEVPLNELVVGILRGFRYDISLLQ